MTDDQAISPSKRLTLSPTRAHSAAILGAGLVALLIYLTTLQVIPNGSQHAYGTDVGEIQNALPRWGTLHFPGYPLYSISGSLFVTILRVVGVQPAVSTSLFSALWGAVSVSLLVVVALRYRVPAAAAVVTALLYALATSVWVDASLAEIHTMTMSLTLAALLLAIDFGRSGRRSTLLWLTFFAAQMVLHQRAMVFVGPAMLLFILPQWPVIRHALLPVLGVATASALVYVYIPLRDWMGADWTFNAPGTWSGFWSLVLDTKTERIVNLPETATDIGTRLRAIGGVLAGDWPLILLVVGLFSLLLVGRRKNWREAAGLLLVALPFLALSLVIWIGRTGDALLAVNLPVYAMAAVGLAVLTATLHERSRPLGVASMVFWLVSAGYLYLDHRPQVLTITRDPDALQVIEIAQHIDPAGSDRPLTLMALWGRDFWALAYAQGYQEALVDVELVDHNADLKAILDGPRRFLTLSSTFYGRPLPWWEERFGPVHLATIAPGIVEIEQDPPFVPPADSAEATGSPAISLDNGLSIQGTDLSWHTPDELWLTVYWQAERSDLEDYSVAVHLVAQDPPIGPNDILAQADQAHPVEGWYPVSRWQKGEVVRDVYRLQVPPVTTPAAVRLSMYQVGDDGSFVNTEWLSIPLASGADNE